MKRSTIVIVTGVVAWPMLSVDAAAQSREERVQSLSEHAVALRTIDPVDDDFSDLEPLRVVLESVRVVLLGEQSHGDGATFLAKARLVSFLHREMGFDVLAFESGFYECEKAEELMRLGEDAHTAIRRCVFPIWTESAEFQPTIDYLGDTRAGDRPLRIAGFDNQVTGAASAEFLLGDLRTVAQNARSGFDWTVHGAVLQDVIEGSFLRGAKPSPDEEMQHDFQEALLQLELDVQNSSLNERAYWSQVIRSLTEYAGTVWMMGEGQPAWESVRVRDRQMAENLLGHLDHTLADRKVIVWTATFHSARNLNLIESDSVDVAEAYGELSVMGGYLEDALGSEMYSIGFIAFDGEVGLVWNPPSRLPPAAADSLEGMLAEAGFEFAFLNLRNLDPATEWLRLPVTSRPLGYVPMSAPWGRVVDGLIFTRQMTPSTQRDP